MLLSLSRLWPKRRFVTRLYEQERGKPEGFPLLGSYVRRWLGWCEGRLPDEALARLTPPRPLRLSSRRKPRHVQLNATKCSWLQPPHFTRTVGRSVGAAATVGVPAGTKSHQNLCAGVLVYRIVIRSLTFGLLLRVPSRKVRNLLL